MVILNFAFGTHRSPCVSLAQPEELEAHESIPVDSPTQLGLMAITPCQRRLATKAAKTAVEDLEGPLREARRRVVQVMLRYARCLAVMRGRKPVIFPASTDISWCCSWTGIENA